MKIVDVILSVGGIGGKNNSSERSVCVVFLQTKIRNVKAPISLKQKILIFQNNHNFLKLKKGNYWS